MRLFLLTALTMTAFAANSILNRAAVGGGDIGAIPFGAVRLAAGACVLLALVLLLRRKPVFGGPGRVPGVAGLFVYVFGFSWAYQALDAGLGALILFGCVQITMFCGAIMGGETPPRARWAGAIVALGGLAWLLWPGAGVTVSLPHAAAMVAAGIGWGGYSLAGRATADPLVATMANFALAAPAGLLLAGALPGSFEPATPLGLALAVLSGAVASGMGYALWYSVLPRIPGTVAAIAQLSVPVIAMAGGAALLGEVPDADAVLAGAIVLGGIGLSVLRR
ncbi:DMT family transporter [Citreimonas salinaria]|uniref:EamA-like transporter family protein n=1 Tax=Citreimonas salinaria TaxID=321339 RepID=A0A1H3FET3_9RHOB|nr:DMT family transporter [Citreimonas salinaria]SDX89501.1 EamA-like transporter family protein [Citreimonas salinaria]